MDRSLLMYVSSLAYFCFVADDEYRVELQRTIQVGMSSITARLLE